MYLIHITIKTDQLPAGQADALLAQHRAWFTRHFEAGDFLLLGPYLDQPAAGLIVAQAPSRDALAGMLAEDVYHPNGWADYTVREFKVGLAAEKLSARQGQ
jgi:uncharacterized protein YciI